MLRDRRRIGQGATLLLAIVLMANDLALALPASAQGFGWGYYRVPGQRRRAPSRRPVPQPVKPAPVADVPLPVPRPPFPGESPAPPSDGVSEPAKPPSRVELPAPPATLKPATPPSAKPPPETKPPAGEAAKPAEPPEAKPSVSKPGSGGEQVPPRSSVPPLPANGPPLPPPKPPELSQPGNTPTVAPSGARLGETPGQPDDDAGCVERLKARKVVVEATDIGPQPDARCTVVRAVRLSGLTLPEGGKVEFPEHPTIACTTADAFSLFVRDLLSPLAKGTYGSPVAKVWTGPGLECRSRDHIFGAKLSAHGQGLAIDIAQMKLANDRMIEVGQPKSEADQGFESAARAAGCGYFHTALGPGTDEYHRTHWHFDLEVRGAKGDSKYCR